MQPPQQPVAPGSTRRRRLVKVVVYGALVVLVALIALTARGFSRDVGDARVAGRFSLLPLLRSRTPAQLALTWNGLTLHFSRARTPSVRGFESEGDATDIVFDDGSRLRLAPGSDTGGSLSLTPAGGAVPSASRGASGSVVVPFTLEGVLQSPPPAGATLAWKHAGRTFLLTLPAGAESNPEDGTLTLPLSGSTSAVLQAQGIAPAASQPTAAPSAAARVPREEDMPGVDNLQAAISAWADASWRGWSSSRYSPSDDTWRMADGNQGFSENLGVGLLSQSVARGTWQTAFSLWADALARQQRSAAAPALTFVASAYLGGTKDFASAFQRRTDAEVARVSAAMDRGDRSIVASSNLIPLVVNHGGADLVEKTGRFLAGRSAEGLDIASALGLAADLLDYVALVRSDEAMQRELKDIVEKSLLPAVRSTDAGVFIDSGDRTSSARSNILAGSVLLRAGPVLGSSLVSAVGRGLLVSSLALSDQAGFLPVTLTLDGSRIGNRVGTLAPEDIYPLVPGIPFIPRETSLASQLGRGSWIWTSAQVASVVGTSTGIALLFSYPRGVPYHLVIHGLKPFSGLKLHGIPWHSDPTYFKYSDGWAYDSASQALFMKITGRTDQERVEIAF